MVDLGLGFAEEDKPGADIILPKIKFIEKYRDKLDAIIVTHAHEDHIGALPYLWTYIQVPIYSTKFTAEVINAKFKEFSIEQEADIKVIDTNGKFSIGDFHIEFVGITHSIPEMQAVKISTDVGTIFATGDWKWDENPVQGIDKFNDSAKFEKIGDEGVLAVIGDSTNIFTAGTSGSEGDLSKNLAKIISRYNRGMVIVTTFASNIARLYSIAKAATESGRKVALVGRALWRLYQAALNSGYLMDLPPFLTMDEVRAQNYKRENILLICTGCQGEPMAAINRMAAGNHPDVTLNKDDTIIFSSKVIPGNERRIFNLLNVFVKKGIEVLTERDYFVHVSGHPARDEVAKLYKMLRPKIAVPVHGEAMHLNEHCKFAKEQGVPHAIQVENGDMVCLSGDNPGKIAKVESGYVVVDGNYIIDENSVILKERRELRANGVMVVFLLMNKNGKIIRRPRISAYGLLDYKKDRELLDLLISDINKICDTAKKRDEKSIGKAVAHKMMNIMRTERGKNPRVSVQIEKLNF